MGKKVLLIGNGAREHAIAEALNRSRSNPEIYAFMSARNPGIEELAAASEIAELTDEEALKRFVQREQPELAIIGPEAPLAAGIVDFLENLNIPCVGPNKQLAQLETSKGFTRELLSNHDIPGNPDFRVFVHSTGIKEYIEELQDYVVKADGLRSGKGVKVSGEHLHSVDEASHYANQCLKEDGTVIIEEKLEGEEFSLMAFTDGTTIRSMPCVQDHKRAHDNDEGPNTGGMGSYSDHDHKLPFLTEEEIEDAKSINKQVNDALKEELKEPYKGIIYGGFMATKSGVKLIEYNARLGDPEAMNVLPLLETDFLEICEAITEGTLDKTPVLFKNEATVCKYVVPEGYPDSPTKGPLEVTEEPQGKTRLYYAAIDKQDGKLFMTGSRAIAIVGFADSITNAEQFAERVMPYINGAVFHRRDIGTQALIKKRITHMEQLR